MPLHRSTLALGLSTLLFVSLAAAQTTPAPAPAPAVPTPATPTTAPASPAPATAPAPATTAPAPAAKAPTTSAATNRLVAATAIGLNKAVKGQLVTCPASLKVSREAVCLYSKSAPATLRPAIRGSLGAQALGDWKTSGQASSLLVRESATGNVGAYVLLSGLSATETLIVLDAVQASARAAARPAAPSGVVKGQPYVLGRDLIGVVNVLELGGGKYRLNAAGQTAITVTAGVKTAQRPGGNIELPLAPATDGKNLIFPLAGLRALGCTVSDAATGVTIACGSESVGVRPIVF